MLNRTLTCMIRRVGCPYRIVDVVSPWIFTARNRSCKFKTSSIFTAVDRKWSYKAVPREAGVFSQRLTFFDVRLVDSNLFPPWQKQTGSSYPRRFLVWQTSVLMDCDCPSEANPVGFGRWTHGGNRSGKPLLICCHHHTGKRL